MADCTDNFLRFHENISLSKTAIRYLRQSKSVITRKIKNHFGETPGCPRVGFMPQGSFALGTKIKPLYDYDTLIKK